MGNVHFLDPVTILENPAASQTSPNIDFYIGIAFVEFINSEQFPSEPVKKGSLRIRNIVEVEKGSPKHFPVWPFKQCERELG